MPTGTRTEMTGYRVVFLLCAVWLCLAAADQLALESGEIYFPSLLGLDSQYESVEPHYNVLDNSFVREKLAGKVKPPKADPRPPSEEPLPIPTVLPSSRPVPYQTDQYISRPVPFRYPKDYVEIPQFKEPIVYRPLFHSPGPLIPTQLLLEHAPLDRPIDHKPVYIPKPDNKPNYSPYPPYQPPEQRPSYPPRAEPEPVYIIEEKPTYIPKPEPEPAYVPKYDVTTYKPQSNDHPSPIDFNYPHEYQPNPQPLTQRPPVAYEKPDEVRPSNVRIGGDHYKPMTGAKLADGHNMYIPERYEEGDYSGIPGRPGRNYPIYSYPPQTDFLCSEQQYPGYYADTEAYCQVFHICQADGRAHAFLCPNGTLFSQQYFVCDWWYNVNCANAIGFYPLNAYLYSDVHSTPYRRPYSN